MAPKTKEIKTWKRKTATGFTYSIMYIEDPGHWHATGQVTEEDALRWAKYAKADILRPEGITLDLFAIDFFLPEGEFARNKEKRKKPRTATYLQQHDGWMRNYILPRFGKYRIADITAAEINDWLLDLRLLSSGKPMSGSQKNKIREALRIVLQDAILKKHITYNVTNDVESFSKEPETPRGTFSPEEMGKLFPDSHEGLLKNFLSQMWVAYFLVMADTGLRPGEIRALQWGDWWPDERFFPIKKGIAAGTKADIKETKTGESSPAFVSPKTASALSLWYDQCKHTEPTALIFSEDGAYPPSNTACVQHFRSSMKRAGLECLERTPYWLRHDFNTRGLETLSEEDMRTLMRHRTEAMTHHYNHPADKQLLERGKPIREKLDKRWGVGGE